MVFFSRFRLMLPLVFCAHVTGYANTVVLTPFIDTTITQKSGTELIRLDVGANGMSQVSRSFVQFDVAGNVPAGATITSASLTVTVVQVPAGAPPNSIFDLRRVRVSWDETNATWTLRNTGLAWTVAGGQIGADFTNKVTQTNFFDQNENAKTWVSNSNMVADVQFWLTNASANFGWVIMTESENTDKTQRGLGSSESGATAPKLTIQYTAPAAKPTLTVLGRTNNNFRFSFPAETNRTYSAQFIGDPTKTNWTSLTNFSAATIPTNRVVSDPLTPSNRYYRVQTP